MDSYNGKSCSVLEKPFYRPVEAALRWCNLIQHEDEILRATGNELFPGIGVFPEWPCLRANAEKIYDAILHDGLPHGRDGRAIVLGEHVAKGRLTIRHIDLREWMAKHYPNQKPAFLFDEVERDTHATYNAVTFRVLQADRDALKVRIEKADDILQNMNQELGTTKGERDSLRAMIEKIGTPGGRSETTYLNIIGGMLALMLGKAPSGKPLSSFENQSSIISALLVHHDGKPGIAVRTLEEKFAAAKRSLIET